MAREPMVPLSILLDHVKAMEESRKDRDAQLVRTFTSALGELVDGLEGHLERVAELYADALKPPPLPTYEPSPTALHMSEAEEDAQYRRRIGVINDQELKAELQDAGLLDTTLSFG